jgi:hypothetical protein
MRKLVVSEDQFKRLVNNIIKEEEGVDEVYITPDEYYALLKQVGNMAHAIPQLPKFRGKKLIIKGNLDLSGNKKIISLGDVKVDGNVNVQGTSIRDIKNLNYTGRFTYWNTPLHQKELQIRQQKRIAENEQRREDKEWDLSNTDEEGEMANAAFDYAVGLGLLKARTEEEEEEYQELERRMEEIKDRMEAEEDEELYDEMSSEYDELEERLDELKNTTDVYDLYPEGNHYYLHRFMSLSEGFEIAVGTEYQADKSMRDYFQEWVDSPEHYINRDTASNHIDGDTVADEFEYVIREWYEEDPSNYNVTRNLSSNQEEEIWLLEMEKWVYENEGVRAPISEATREEGDVFDFEDVEGNRFQYRNTSTGSHRGNWVLYKNGQVVSPHQIYEDEDTQEHEDDRESRISDIEYEIESIKNDPDGEYNEDEIEELIEDRLNDIRRNPTDFLDELGLDYFEYMDKDSLLEDLINSDDYGNALNGYDGSYDEIRVNDNYYIVMRID